MEGENKNMKMKKLTALALAGVLCMGMSATAFAADSNTTDDAKATVIDAKTGKEVETQLYNKNDEKIDKVVITETVIDLSDIPEKAAADIRYWSTDTGKSALKEAIKEANGKVNADAPIAIVKEGDFEADVNWDYLKEDGQELQVKFNVSDLKINTRTELTDGDTLNLMHWVDDPTDKVNGGRWVCIPTKLAYEKGILYATANFNPEDGMSPILFVAQKGAINGGSDIIDDPTKDPVDDPTKDPSVIDPDKDGKVTIDDIANAVVKKLQSTNTKVVRVNSGVSPKTGE